MYINSVLLFLILGSLVNNIENSKSANVNNNDSKNQAIASSSQSSNTKFVKANDNVVLECRVEAYNEEWDKVEWCKNEFCTWGRAVELRDGRLKYNSLKKYYIVGNWRAGEWSLLIENVTDSDAGEFKCLVTRRTDDYTFKFETTVVNLVLMEKPTSIVINGTNKDTKSHELILSQSAGFYCAVEKGRPEPKIYWSLIDSNDETISEKNPKERSVALKRFNLERNNFTSFSINSSRISSLESYFYFSWLHMSITNLALVNKSLVCVAEHEMLSEPLVRTVRLNVKYAPILTIRYEPDEPLMENRNYTFFCDSSSNPADDKTKKKFYLIDNKRKRNIDISGKTLTMEKSLNLNLVVCESENEIGRSISNMTLNVLYAPQFIRTPEPLVMVNKSANSVSLTCQVESNPRAVIFWLKNDKEVVQIGERLKLARDLSRSDNFNAEYTCQARTTVFESISRRVVLVSEGVPTFIGDMVYYSSGASQPLNIEFTILSNPPYQFGPICTKISNEPKNNDPLEIILPIRNPEKYELQTNDYEELKTSTKFKLSIKRMSNWDVGLYNCTVTNKHGLGVYNFEIRRRAEEGSFWLTLSFLIIALLVILVLIAAIFLLIVIQRRRNSLLGAKMCRKVNTLRRGGAAPLPSVSDFSGSSMKKASPASLSRLGSSLCYHQSDTTPSSGADLFTSTCDTSDNNTTMNGKYSLHANRIGCDQTQQIAKSLSDDYAIDKTFKKQSNQISLIEPSLDGNNFSFESLTFTSDTQNLLLFDNFKSVYATAIHSRPQLQHQANTYVTPTTIAATASSSGTYQHHNHLIRSTADILGSKFQTNV